MLARPSLIVWDECFPAGTLVDGRPIETIRRGDMVWSFNHVSGRIESRRVVQLMKSSPSNMVRVAIGDKVVACTAGHPFYVEGKGYVPARQLALGDRLLSDETATVSSCPRVDGVTHIKPSDDGTFGGVCRDGCVYNFEVEGNNNYFVDGMLVHNCHHIAAGSWADVFRANPEARHIGLTATPERLDGVGLGRWFQRLVLGPSVADLIDGGWLAKFKIYSPPGASLSGVHMLGGDYNKRELNAVLDGSAVMGDVLTHYRKLAPGRRMVAFTWSVASSVELAGRFSAAGIPAEHVDGTTSMHNRDAAMSRFRRGETMVLTNVDLFGEGLDVPAIEAVALLRPTQSLGLYVQQVGRALRPAPGKSHAIILDHAGNALRHGLPDDPRDWSLDSERRKRVGDHAAPVRQCPKCYAVMPADRPMCIECGFEFPTKSRKIAEIVGELQEMQLRRDKRMEQRKADTMQKLISIGRARGYRNPAWWAWMVFTHRRNG